VLDPEETLLAVAFGSVLVVYEVARLVQGIEKPVLVCNNVGARDMCWTTMPNQPRNLVVLTNDRQIHVYNLMGHLVCTHSDIEATSLAWSPQSNVLAVGDDEGVIHKLSYTYNDGEAVGSFIMVESMPKPEHVGDNFQVRHLNWAEDNLILAGYKTSDNEEAASCIFDGDNTTDMGEIVSFFPSDSRQHEYFSCYLKAWRMFFVGCSVSTDIELVVSDPETNEWQIWKPLEKYTPRLPMNSDDEDTYPVGMSLILNSTVPLPGDELDSEFYPCPLILCGTTDGIALSFALLDTNEE
ncbi:nuclear pore complex protein, partial [Thraustotheca clavata]